MKLRAAQRAIEKRAPFHRQRNGIDDAILIEVYADAVGAKATPGSRFAFVTHNTKDFSQPNANNKLPHSDIAGNFSRARSLYFITLGEALRRVRPAQLADLMIEEEWVEEPRRLTEIVDVIGELIDKVWYNRHQVTREKIESGDTKIVEKETFPVKDHTRRPIQRDVWEGALKSAAKVESLPTANAMRVGRELINSRLTDAQMHRLEITEVIRQATKVERTLVGETRTRMKATASANESFLEIAH